MPPTDTRTATDTDSTLSRRHLLTHASAAGAVGGVVTLAALGPIADRTQAAESNELWFDVTDFGAVGDGDTDDLEAIRDTINTAFEAGGATVYIPAGLYLVGGQIDVKGGVTLRGAGKRVTTLVLDDHADAHVIQLSQEEANMAVCDLSIDGNKQHQSVGAHGIRFATNSNVAVRRVSVINAGRYGLGVASSSNNPPLPMLTDSLVEDVEISEVGNSEVGDGFDCKSALRCIFRNIYIHDCGNGHSMDIRGQDLVLENIWAVNNGKVGIAIRCSDGPVESKKFVVANNLYAVGNGSFGIWLDAEPWGENNVPSGRIHVANAIARENSESGYYLAAGGDTFQHLVNCLAEDNGRHGFYVNHDNSDTVHSKLVSCTAIGNAENGFTHNASNGRGDVFVGCNAVDNFYGFYIDGYRHTFVGCQAEHNEYDDMCLIADDCTVSGGCISAISGPALRIHGGNRNLVTGMTVETNSGVGITIHAGSAGNRLVANNLTNVAETKVDDKGQDTVGIYNADASADLDDARIAGDLTHSGDAVGFFGVSPASQFSHVPSAETSHALSTSYDNTEIGAAMDVLGTKVNSILASLEGIGLHADK